MRVSRVKGALEVLHGLVGEAGAGQQEVSQCRQVVQRLESRVGELPAPAVPIRAGNAGE